MKTKIGVAILAAICAGLLVALLVVRNQGDEQQKKSTDTILDLSNQVMAANDEVNGLGQANLVLSNDLITSWRQAQTFSNNAVQVAGSLQVAQNQITNLDARVADLEAQNQALDQHAADLSNTITNLSEQITETQIKLVTSETNNAFLESALKQQVAEKAELQHKFDDLTTVRAQVKKLRDDAITARRLEWIREGIDPTKILKGGEVLMQHTAPATNSVAVVTAPKRKEKTDNDRIAAPLGPNFNLNVEVGSDGSVHVIPALPGTPAATNAPSH